MTDYEPYVSDPAEPRLPPPLARYRLLLVVLVVLIVLVAAITPVLRDRQLQDPSLGVPAEQEP